MHADLTSLGISLLLKSTAILMAAWILTMLLRRRSAGIRHAVWSVAFGAILFLPVITASMPALHVEVPHVSRSLFSSPALPTNSSNAGPTPAHLQHETSSPLVAHVEAETLGKPSVPERERTPAYLLGVWLIGAAGLLTSFLAHLVRVYRATLRSAPKERTDEIATEVAESLGMSRRPRVLLGPIDMPASWGLFRPVILLPEEAIQWGGTRLRIVLMHEMGHIRRVDYLPHLLTELAAILYWPNPLVWVARHRLRAEQERACDDFVLRAGTASHDYAALLLDLARSARGRMQIRSSLGMAERSGLKTRIRAVLDPSVERKGVSLSAFAVVAVALTVPALTIASLRSGANDQETGLSPTLADTAPAADSLGGDMPAATEPSSARPFVYTRMVEAEDAVLTPPMIVRTDETASGGKYAVVPDQDGHDPPDGGPGHLQLSLDMGASVGRAVWARVIGDRDNDNSFFVSLNGGQEFRWDIRTLNGDDLVSEWTWLPVIMPSGRPLQLQSGHQVLTFRNREDGSRIDAVFVTSDPDLIPHGKSLLPPPDTFVSLDVEAEQPFRLVAPLEIRADEDASGRLYLSVADGFDSRDKAPEDGQARYRINVPQAGRYVVWARVMAPDDDEDSFWIRANDADWIRWNGIPESDTWRWQLVHDSDAEDVAVLDLPAGENEIVIAYREDGTKIDRFALTNSIYSSPGHARETKVHVTFKE